MLSLCSQCESEPIGLALRRILLQPWTIFILRWNWKAALLSAAIRGSLICGAVIPHGAAALRGAWIEVVFRIAIGGCWGSLMQALRRARPAWMAGLLLALILPAGAHTLEYAALVFGGATHIRSAMTVSVLLSAGSLAVNYALMRRGLMLTVEGAPSLGSDFRGMPIALWTLALSIGTVIRRSLRRPR